MSTTTTARPLTEDDLIGQLVIAWDWDSPVHYVGQSDPVDGASMIFGRRIEVDAPFAQVAPADAPVPVKDPRLAATKAAKGYYPTWQGPWRLTIDGQPGGFHKTKRDALAAGARRLAIIDWHATNAALEG